jgi:hypothetical protein
MRFEEKESHEVDRLSSNFAVFYPPRLVWSRGLTLNNADANEAKVLGLCKDVNILYYLDLAEELP